MDLFSRYVHCETLATHIAVLYDEYSLGEQQVRLRGTINFTTATAHLPTAWVKLDELAALIFSAEV